MPRHRKEEKRKAMKNRSNSKSCEEIKELIRVKVDLYGLTKEDIDYMIENGLARILKRGGEEDKKQEEK